MEFRLLGAVEARFNGRAVDLGPAPQRCLLAALLIDLNHVVPADQLLTRAWGDRIPRRARDTLYSYLSRLRHALAGAENVDIAHRSGGYLLTADPSTVDVHCFRQLVRSAREAADDEHAAVLFGRALALWRGNAFATLDTPWLNQVRTVLAAERRAAELDRNEIELRQGRHGELLPGLTTSAAENPFDERLAAQLMLAMYRAGRQAEAIRVYHDTRSALIEELGLEPGRELVQLHQRILSADLPPTGPVTRSAVPRQLPVDILRFTGRKRYLADLRNGLESGEPPAAAITVIEGTAGVGKTALAVHFGHKIAHGFPDGQLYLDLRGYAPTAPLTTAEALGWLLRSLGLPAEQIPIDEQEQAALYRSVLAGKRLLVVLDDARGAAQVRPLLPAGPGCLVVITSRTTLTALDGARHLHLDMLTEDEALALLAKLTGDDRVRQEPDAASRVITLCARLPLAVRIAGARLAARPHWTIAALVDRMTDEQRRLDELEVGDRAVRASFAVTQQALATSADPIDRRAARTFRLLGVLDWLEISVPVAAALLDLPQHDTREALERLLDAHLLDSTAPGRYHTHDLLRIYAREAARNEEPEPVREAALRRALVTYLAAAEQATLLLTSIPHDAGAECTSPPHGGFTLPTPADAAAWVGAEQVNLVAAARQAAANKSTAALAVRLTASLTLPFEIRGHWRELVALRELAASTARQLADRRGEALACQDLGFAYTRFGRVDEAITAVRRALRIWREIGDRRGEPRALKYLGFAYFEQNRMDEAITCHQQALAICRDIDDRYGQAGALNALGLDYQRLGRFAEAIGCHDEALALNRAIGNRYGEASALGNLGWANLRAGELDQAVAGHQGALHLARAIGNDYQEAESLWGLGQVQQARGRLDEARGYWDQALTILHDLRALTAAAADTLRRQPIPDTPEIIQRNT